MTDPTPVDPRKLKQDIDAFLDEHACPGSSHPEIAFHCAECCYGTGFTASCAEELAVLQALDVASIALKKAFALMVEVPDAG